MPQLGNGVPIVSFEIDMQDKELLGLQAYLLEAAKHYDLADYNCRYFKLGQYASYDSRRDLITNLMN